MWLVITFFLRIKNIGSEFVEIPDEFNTSSYIDEERSKNSKNSENVEETKRNSFDSFRQPYNFNPSSKSNFSYLRIF